MKGKSKTKLVLLFVLTILLIVSIVMYVKERVSLSNYKKKLEDSEVKIYDLNEEKNNAEEELKTFLDDHKQTYEEYQRWEELDKEIETYLN